MTELPVVSWAPQRASAPCRDKGKDGTETRCPLVKSVLVEVVPRHVQPLFDCRQHLDQKELVLMFSP